MATSVEDKAVAAAAKADPDAQPWTPKQLQATVRICAVRSHLKSENNKVLVTVGSSPIARAHFKSNVKDRAPQAPACCAGAS